MAISPDTKDWTWVLRRPCPECGVDVSAHDRVVTGELVRRVTAAWVDVLAADRPLAERPRPDRWSPLEYGCHVRDVLRIYDERLELMLTRDDPLFPNWDQDATAVEERYGEQDPTVVATALAAHGHRLAAAFDGLDADQWSRRGSRSDGADFDVESFSRYFLHDPLHHLWDVGHPVPAI